LPLALVSKAFLHAARKILYGAPVIKIHTRWHLSLFVRTLQGEQVSAFDNEESDVEMALIGSEAPDHSIASMVRGLDTHVGE